MREDEMVMELARTLAARPSGLVTDIDGTISEIAPTPDAAVVHEDARRALGRLARRLDVVGAITGRSAEDGMRLLGVDGAAYVGNHGLERIEDGRRVVLPDVVPYVDAIGAVLESVRPAFEAAGYLIENKGVTASIHYRGLDEPDRAEEEILRALAPHVERADLRLARGRMVVELRPPVERDKGTALVDLVDAFGLRSLVFLGDDVTDLDAMRALRDLRQRGQVIGLTVGVIAPEGPPELRAEADLLVDGVPGVVSLLTRLADRLDAGEPTPQ